MLTIFHRYSKSTLTNYFSASGILHFFLRRLSWSLVVSFVHNTSYCLFHHKTSSFSLRPHTTSYEDSCILYHCSWTLQINLLHFLFSKNGRLAYFHCIIEIRDISLRPSHLLLHFPPRGSFFLNLSRQNYI